jgi:hypothetical protein
MYEELLSTEEVGRSLELEEMFVVLPAFRAIYRDIDYTYPGTSGKRVNHPYNSSQEPRMSKNQLAAFIINNQLLPEDFGRSAKFNHKVAECGS